MTIMSTMKIRMKSSNLMMMMMMMLLLMMMICWFSNGETDGATTGVSGPCRTKRLQRPGEMAFKWVFACFLNADFGLGFL